MRHFPNWIRAYAQYTLLSEAPLEFHFWTAVSTIAAVLKARVWHDELHFRWTPNFYIIFVGPAGVVTKSTTLSIGYDILRGVELPGGGTIKFGPDSMTWHGLAHKFAEAVEYCDYIPPGTTEPQLIKMAPLTCSVSELGTFLRPDDKALISFLTDAWDGKMRPFEHSTLTNKELVIENPWLNVIGATTPNWIRDNFPASMLQQGIGSRIIFVYGEQKRHYVAYPSRLQGLAEYQETGRKLTEDLQHISTLLGHYELTPAAYAWGTEWYEAHMTRGPQISTASARYEGYMARKQTHIHKLAMVLAAAQRDQLVIEAEDLQEAAQILTATEQSMHRVFEHVDQREEAKYVKEIVRYVTAYGWITSEDLYKLCWNLMSKSAYVTAVREAHDSGLIVTAYQNGRGGLSPNVRT